MELEQQVCSLELAKRLEELGVKQESFFQWEVSGSRSYIRWNQYAKCGCEFMTTASLKFRYSAFTVAELLEKVTVFIIIESDNGFVRVIHPWGPIEHEESTVFEDKNLADALAEMMIHLLENKLITL